MDLTVIVGSFGSNRWAELARKRAVPSAESQAPVIHVHGKEFPRYGDSLAICRNAGAMQAKTEWLCFLDADDELMPGFVEAMDKATADLRIPAAQYVPRHRRPGKPMFWPDDDIQTLNYMIVSTVIRREMFWEAGGFQDVPLYEDWQMFGRCLKMGATVERVPDAIYRVHINPRSKHRQGTTQAEKLKAYHLVRRSVWPELYPA